jgi:spermidine/putrescine transport system ATP-binding protein
MESFLEFDGVTKRFGPLTAVDNVSLTLRRGEVFALLGPSGCGKTTLLRIAAGFEQPDSGRVILNGQDITDLPPHKRKLNTVFQNYALFPHLTARDNIAFGLRVARRPRAVIREEVGRMLRLTQMEEQAHKRPAQISGGEKQRVAIARALINKPDVLLLDEPLAALDLKLRQKMLMELDRIHDEVGITFLYVTHDQGEAMSLSDRMAVMNDGRLEQIGKPMEIYEAPKSRFVAAFVGDTNFFDGTVEEVTSPEYSRLAIDGFPSVLCFNDRPMRVGEAVHLTLRPEKIRIHADEPEAAPQRNRVQGTVEDIIYQGSHTRYWVRADGFRIGVLQPHGRWLLDRKPITFNDRVWLDWHADDGFMLLQDRPGDGSV